MSQVTVLVISRTTSFFSEMKQLLGRDDIQTCHVESWEQAQPFIEADQMQLIVLHCPGPGIDGLAVCREVRARYQGLLVLVSGDGDELFHILALGLGVDASLASNVGVPLVVAYIKALLRRFAPAKPLQVLVFGRLSVDAKRRDVFVAEQAVQLSTIEFQLFWALAQKPGCVVSRDEIHTALYNASYNGYDRNIDLYISRIRQKIGDDPVSPHYLKTVRGIGYQFVGTEKKLSDKIPL